MLFGTDDWAFLAGFVAIVGGLAAAIAFGLDQLNRRRPWLTLLLSTLAVPATLAKAALIFGTPDPRSVDGPAMTMVVLFALAIASVPVSFAASALVVRLRRAPEKRSRT